MCAPNLGEVEPWRLLQSDGDVYLFKQAPEARLRLMQEEQQAKNEALRSRTICAGSYQGPPCVSFKPKDAKGKINELKIKQKKVVKDLHAQAKGAAKHAHDTSFRMALLQKEAQQAAARSAVEKTNLARFKTGNKDMREAYVNAAIANPKFASLFEGLKTKQEKEVVVNEKWYSHLRAYKQYRCAFAKKSYLAFCSRLCKSLGKAACDHVYGMENARKVIHKGDVAQRRYRNAKSHAQSRARHERSQKQASKRKLPRLMGRISSTHTQEQQWKHSVKLQRIESSHLDVVLKAQIAVSAATRKAALDKNYKVLSRGHTTETRNAMRDLVDSSGRKTGKQVPNYRYQKECEVLTWDSKKSLPVATALLAFKKKHRHTRMGLKDMKDDSKEPQRCGEDIVYRWRNWDKYVLAPSFDANAWASDHPSQVLPLLCLLMLSSHFDGRSWSMTWRRPHGGTLEHL